MAVGVLSITLTACNPSSSTAGSKSESSHVITVTPTISVEPTQAPEEPKTLEAATATAQELANRFTSGDYAGAWEMKSKQLRDNLSEADYVTYNNTCTKHNALNGIPITVTGVRMDGSDKALVRWDALGFQQTNTMVYEDGKWAEIPTDF
jgi:hypothetical protein